MSCRNDVFFWELDIGKIEDGYKTVMYDVTMQITVKTLNGDHYVVPYTLSITPTVKWLKEQIHKAEPTFTPFSQQIFPVTTEDADAEDEAEDADELSDHELSDHELSDHDLLLDTHYLLLIHPDRVGITFVDHTGRFGDGFTLDVDEIHSRLPSAVWWEEQIQLVCRKYHNTKALAMNLKGHIIPYGGIHHLRMFLSVIRRAIGEPWTKQVILHSY